MEKKKNMRHLCRAVRRLLLLSLLSVKLSLLLNAQQTTVTGFVKDSSGQPLSGVTLSVKGTDRHTVSGKDGSFSIEAAKGDSIRYSSVGYESGVFVVNDSSPREIILNTVNTVLGDIVVVGFGRQKKTNLTGAVGVIDSRAFEAIPVQNAVQALQGRVPGLNITQTSGGALNARAGIDVRGLATIGQGSSGGALVLIDGIEGDLFSINPQDIASVSVLKDAAASSIYGSRAPFGVLLVTTKKGQAGKTKFNYNNSFRYNSAINMPKEMDSYTWAIYFNEASNNAGWGDVIGPEQLGRIKDYIDGNINTVTIPNPGNPNTWSNGYELANDNIDYYKVFYKEVTPAQEHNLSISGGSDHVSFYVSGNYLDQGGLMKFGSDGLKRYNLFGKLDARLSKIASINYNSRYIRSDYHQPRHMSNDFFQEIGRQSWPIGPLYDPNGFLFNDHALTLRDGGEIKNQASSIIQQATLTLEPVKGWHIVGSVNYRNETNFNHEDGKPIVQMQVDGIHPGNEWYYNWVSESASKNDYLNYNIYSDYEKTIRQKHYFKILGGFQAEDNNYRDLWASKDGIMVLTVPTINTTSGMGKNGDLIPPRVSGGYSSWSTAGFFGRVNYSFKEKYLFEANLRYDGSSRFRENNRWGFFPSFSAGWNIAREAFFEPLSGIFSELKLRGSYGSLGNQNTSSLYPTYTTMGYSTSSGGWLINGARPNISWAPGLISTSLTWEKIQSWNLALDWSLLKNRLTGSFDYFVRNTLNMVGPSDELPVILGTGVPVTNNTDLSTRGFELELGWKDRIFKELGYNVRFVLSDAQGKITRYSNPSGTLSQYYEGMKWGEIWGYQTVGIARTNEAMQEHLSGLPNGGQENLGSNWVAGDIMYADINGDGKINSGAYTIGDHGDLRVIGNATPRYSYGFSLGLDWKGIDFSIFLQGVAKRDYFQGSFYFWGADAGGRWNSMGLVQHADYFRDNPGHPLGLNPDGYYPRPLWGTNKNQQVQTRYLQNAAYLRIKNLQLGYSLPSKIISKARLEKVRLFFSGENLATFTKMSKLFDPETISGGSGTGRGNVYPLQKVYSFGINVTF
ncbi:SusC/RagA family TonB-linked outer membrane protein [Niabella beijingensis]|uniref:SusC/RagA family TonB-linked outer membrane protein n=1 Tax=Niabella beijingensis TaxID=2872700 RepID=UPI001CBB8DA2|nr:TonB-dependent receptor [Niabella beijingensis]MBZ4188877.1 TonB-dependent receptor [Niabella beijingensis]